MIVIIVIVIAIVLAVFVVAVVIVSIVIVIVWCWSCLLILCWLPTFTHVLRVVSFNIVIVIFGGCFSMYAGYWYWLHVLSPKSC